MLFEITSAPEGASPQWVRDAWVGVKFQAQQGAPVSMRTQSASEKDVTNRHGYLTNARDVLGLLALANTDAARWYIENTPQMLNPDQVFLFDQTHCRAIAEL